METVCQSILSDPEFLRFFKNSFFRFGGIGGKGGDVVAVATPDITLETVYKQNRSKLYAAKSGKHSSHNFIVGIPGEDLKIPVPVGVALITELGKKLGNHLMKYLNRYR